MSKVKVTILGCGGSGGNPHVGDRWYDTDKDNPKNRRRRASILVECDGTRLLVDTSPDLRAQALDAGFGDVDGVFFTHDHADHCHGIDDLRVMVVVNRQGRPIPAFGYDHVLARIKARFGYVFEGSEGYQALVEPKAVIGRFQLGGLDVLPFEQDHGTMISTGLRFGDIAYSTDLIRMPEAGFDALRGVRVWIVAALRPAPHPTHANLDTALSWIARVKPERAIITHMAGQLDYDTLRRTLPAGVEPAYDGMVIES